LTASEADKLDTDERIFAAAIAVIRSFKIVRSMLCVDVTGNREPAGVEKMGNREPAVLDARHSVDF